MSDSDRALDLAHRMRYLMGQDVEEFELARQIEVENEFWNRTNPQLLQEAWGELSSHERTAWKAWCLYREEHERI